MYLKSGNAHECRGNAVSHITEKEIRDEALLACPGQIAGSPRSQEMLPGPTVETSAGANRDWERLCAFTLIFVSACILLFVELGAFPLFNPDEALYAEPAREMLITGQYVTTFLNYVVRFTKPPLVIWAQALCYHLFGVNEFAARFVGAATGALLIACTYLFAERYCNRKTALIASTMLMTAPLFVGTAREAITDMPLSLFTAAGLMAFYHSFEQRSNRWLCTAYVLTALAVMTKGPVGVIIPIAVLAVYHLIRRDAVTALKFYKPLLGAFVVGLLALPWFVAEIYITKGAYYYEFIVRENFQRFTSVVDHKGAWWYHLAAIAGGFFPWSVFIPGSLFAAVRGAVRGNSGRGVLLFCACTVAVVVGFFSTSVSKLLPYTVPCFPMLAICIAAYLTDAMEKGRRRSVILPMVLVCAATGIALAVMPHALLKLKEAPAELLVLARSGLCVILTIFLVASVWVWRRRTGTAITFAICGVWLCVAGYGVRALELVSDQWEGAIPEYANFAGQSNWPIFVYHMRKPSVTFYAHRQVIIPTKEELVSELDQTNGAYIIGKKADLDFLERLPRCYLVSNKGLYVLLVQRPLSSWNKPNFVPIIRPL